MWKTIQIGFEKYELDEPNRNAQAFIVPLLWLPAKTNQEIVAMMQTTEARVAKLNEETENEQIIALRMDSIYAMLPHFVVRWEFIDPATGEPLPTPREMINANEVDRLKNLPMQIMNDIVEQATNFGQEDEPAVTTGAALTNGGIEDTDPDRGTMAEKVIPLESERPSEPLSLVEAQTPS